MKTYSPDLRQKIVGAYDQGQGSHRQLAKTLGVSRAFVEKLFRQRRLTGSLEAKQRSGYRRLLLDPAALELVARLIEEQSDQTLQELCDLVAEQQSIRVSVPTMCTWLHRLGLRRKKVSARQ